MVPVFKLTNEQAMIIMQHLPKGYGLTQKRERSHRQSSNKVKKNKENSKPILVKQFSETQKIMLGIINKLKSHPAGSNFVKMASNAEMTASHEYIDLSIIENNICNGSYSSMNLLRGDIRKIWQFSYFWHNRSSQLYGQTIEAEKYFNSLYTEIEEAGRISELQRKMLNLTEEIKQVKKKNLLIEIAPQKKLKTPDQFESIAPGEIRLLGQNIGKLPPECMKEIWEIIQQEATVSTSDSDIIQFDLEQLEPLKIRQLQQYVKSQLNVQGRQRICFQMIRPINPNQKPLGQFAKTQLLPHTQANNNQNQMDSEESDFSVESETL